MLTRRLEQEEIDRALESEGWERYTLADGLDNPKEVTARDVRTESSGRQKRSADWFELAIRKVWVFQNTRTRWYEIEKKDVKGYVKDRKLKP